MTKTDAPIADPEWVTIKNIKITKYNRTTSSATGVVSFLRDLPDDVTVSTTYSRLFPRITLFIPFNCFTFHTRNFTNITDVRPLNNRTDLHFSGNQETNEGEQTLF